MRLTSTLVRNFRNVYDSTLTTVDDYVARFVGNNEPGKSSVVHGLGTLDTHEPVPFDLTQDDPRRTVPTDKREATTSNLVPIPAWLNLDPSDIESVAGPGTLGCTARLSDKVVTSCVVQSDATDAAALFTIRGRMDPPKASRFGFATAETLAQPTFGMRAPGTGEDPAPDWHIAVGTWVAMAQRRGAETEFISCG